MTLRNGEENRIDLKVLKVNTNQILVALFGTLITIIAWFALMVFSDMRDDIKTIKNFMVEQQIQNEKHNGVVESLKNADIELFKRIDDNKKSIDEIRKFYAK